MTNSELKDNFENSDSEKWYKITIQNTLKLLESGDNGLASVEANIRQKKYGKNQLEIKKPVSPWFLLLEQFKNILIITLLIATILSAFLGHLIEAVAIFVIVLFAVFLGFIQEYRAEKAMEALKKIAEPNARVLRDNEEKILPSVNLVPGDVFLLSAGDRVPADARLIGSFNLLADEAVLTGESHVVEKTKINLF